MSIRSRRVARQIQAICSAELERDRRSRQGLLTVTNVAVAADLRTARVGISFLNLAESEQQQMLLHLRPELQQAVAEQLKSKFTPKLSLQVDTSAQYAEAITRKLREL